MTDTMNRGRSNTQLETKRKFGTVSHRITWTLYVPQ